MKKWYLVSFSAKLDGEDVCVIETVFDVMMNQEMLIQECADLEIKAADPSAQEIKKWRIISFYAKLDEDDIQAMQSCFFQAMEQALLIKECVDLQIETICSQEET